ncbi:hypothetical protein VXS06_14525 [Photobacterium toruni]|uniref:Uncharacterized protein n=1 Tax=Photobacterium toruni TaxID=1935446 RepID=A0ABU6L9J7_9GAMM|nr:hypothetical protein [Photobacterium toruni]
MIKNIIGQLAYFWLCFVVVVGSFIVPAVMYWYIHPINIVYVDALVGLVIGGIGFSAIVLSFKHVLF